MVSIIDIDHIGYAYKEKLVETGIRTTELLLEKCSTPGGRIKLEELTNISNVLLFRWARLFELFKIEGIGHEHIGVLANLGIDSTRKLAEKDPLELKRDMQETVAGNDRKEKVPSFFTLKKWTEQAKSLSANPSG